MIWLSCLPAEPLWMQALLALIALRATSKQSGTYQHTANGRVVTVTQVLPGLCICNDLYGTFTPTPLYFLHTTEGLIVPEQPTYTGLGPIDGTGTLSVEDGKYVLDFAGLQRIGIGARPRTIIQQ